VDWHTYWLVPSAGVFLALIVFVVFFRMRTRQPTEASVAVHA
jgi:hypothetical protein